MEFSVNHPLLYIMVAVLIAVVLAQSVYFLVRAYRRAVQIGMDTSRLKKTITSAALFTIAPAISILVGVVALSKSLGLPLPWLRLSIIGSLSYETIAAGNTLNELGLKMGESITSASAFVTVAWVMTLGIIVGLVLTPLLSKKIQGGMKKLENMDKGIKVKVVENVVDLTLYIVAEYGVNIVSISETIQNNVKYQLEKITGLKVNNVKVAVESIRVE